MKVNFGLPDSLDNVFSNNKAIQSVYDSLYLLEMTETPLKRIHEQIKQLIEAPLQVTNDFSTKSERLQHMNITLPSLTEWDASIVDISSLYNRHLPRIIEDLKRVVDNSHVIDSVAKRIITLDFGLTSSLHVSLLRLSETIREVMQPSEELLKQVMRLNINAAIELLDSGTGYDAETKRFVINGEAISTGKINILSNASILFDDISLQDMYSLFLCLSKTPHLGLDHRVGRYIFEQSKKLTASHCTIINKNSIFFRGREHSAGRALYVEEEMRKTPFGISGQGRFNSVGIPAFYLCDKKIGVITEVKTHTRTAEYNIQIGVFKNNKRMQLVDVREWNNALSSYFVFKTEDSDKKIDTAYIIPNFFADCLRSNGIEGIIYKSRNGKYSNYVIWEDTHFDYFPEETELVPKDFKEEDKSNS